MNLKRIIYISSAILLLASCIKDNTIRRELPPETTNLDGMWTMVDEDGFAYSYIDLYMGKYFLYISDEGCYYSGKKLWGVKEGSFKLTGSGSYVVKSDKTLWLSGKEYGRLDSYNADMIRIDGVSYERVYSLEGAYNHDQRTVTRMSLNMDDLKAAVGDTLTLQATLEPDILFDRSVIWSSSDPEVASVDASGFVQVKATGTVVITATASVDGTTCSCRLKSGYLGSHGTANCYIVPCAGHYFFDAVTKGNSQQPTDLNRSMRAVVVWESMCDAYGGMYSGRLVENASVNADEGYMEFDASNEEGNALIALCLGDKVIWSWHIWLCSDYYPEDAAITYNNRAGVVMDRNLGALGNLPTDVHSKGLVYQWGRKDPFLPPVDEDSCADFSGDSAFPFLSIAGDAAHGTVQYAVEHPCTFITADAGNAVPDWLYTVDKDRMDLSRWKDDHKTMYDPCPPQWRIPQTKDRTLWQAATGFVSIPDANVQAYGLQGGGLFSLTENDWYPMTAFVESYNGTSMQTSQFGKVAVCWTAGIAPEACAPVLMVDSNASPKADACGQYVFSKGASVRCVRE